MCCREIRCRHSRGVWGAAVRMHISTDIEFSEVFARYCEERLKRDYPNIEIDVVVGTGPNDLPDDVDTNELWYDYCSLSRAEYLRLSVAIPNERRSKYFEALELLTSHHVRT